MFSVDNFYDYLIHLSSSEEKTGIVFLKTPTDGDRNLNNVTEYNFVNNSNYYGLPITERRVLLLDQEPLINEYYQLERDSRRNAAEFNFESMSFLEKLAVRFESIAPIIVTHSDYNNPIIKTVDQQYLIPCYFWFHGIISLDWFHPWRHYKKTEQLGYKRFGLYARSINGNRTYRKKLLLDLSKYSDHVHFLLQEEVKKNLEDHGLYNVAQQWPVNTNKYNGNASANINWQDCKNFNIQIVAETLFDNSGIVHLTEKIFKPIVMNQPFILFGNLGSLKYLRSYGFKTFDNFWDESYDTEEDSNKRYQKIFSLINELSSLSDNEFLTLMLNIQSTVDYNRAYFYSKEFEGLLYNELQSNLIDALEKQKQSMFVSPGGLWFQQIEEFLTFNSRSRLPAFVDKSIAEAIPVYNSIDENLLPLLQKKYPMIFNLRT